MRVRATAIGSQRSNAIGVVELECTQAGLVVVHHGVGAFQEGYAPGALTLGTRVLAPWDSVREASVEDERLFLHLDEAVTPHSRLLLTGFSTGDPPDPEEQRRRRLLVRVGTFAGMGVTGLLVMLTALHGSQEASAGLAVILGCLSAACVLLLGLVAEGRLAPIRNEASGIRLAFTTELAAYVPALSHSLRPDAPKALAPAFPPLPSFQELLPRSTTAVVITMSAALLGAVLTATWVSREPARRAASEDDTPRAASERVSQRQGARPEPEAAPANNPADTPPPPTTAPAPSAATPSPRVAATAGDTVALGGACRCARSDSLLWRDGIPRLSTVLIDKRVTQHHGHAHLELELGVVNNSDQPVPEVSLLVQFFERDPPPSSKRTPTFARPIYFEGPLMPAQALKWHVDARGDDFEVEGVPTALLEANGADAAATNAIADLLKAVHRPIRLHGAMLLAFLGDPRAKEAALGLREALREEEAPYIDRLAWALSDVHTCNVTAAPGANPRSVTACVFNASREPVTQLALRVRALDRPLLHDTPLEPPPLVVAEHVFRLTGQLSPGQGATTAAMIDTSNTDGVANVVFEAYADREEHVF